MRATTIRGPNAFDVTLRFTHKIDHGHKCAFISFPFAKNSYEESKPGSKNVTKKRGTAVGKQTQEECQHPDCDKHVARNSI